jgi:GNAT superfamily N-acetyltransferase
MATDDVVVRRATEADVQSLVELWKEFIDFHARCERAFQRVPDGHEHFATTVRERLADRDAAVFVAKDDTGLVGYCLARVAKRGPEFGGWEFGDIHQLAVTEGRRRCGIGRLLLEAVKAWFVERGVRRMELRVVKENPASTAFWRRLGFRPYVEALWQEVGPARVGSRAIGTQSTLTFALSQWAPLGRREE